MKTIKLFVPMAVLFVSSMLLESCKKENLNVNNTSSAIETNDNKIMNLRGGDLWYYGTKNGNFCTQPCGPFCHVERNFDPFGFGGLDHGIGFYALQPNNLLSVEIDISSLNPEHINAWTNSGFFEVQQTTEIPYESILETCNAAGITEEIPHYFLPQGNWPIDFSFGTGTQKMFISFIDMNTIQVSVQL